MVFRRQGIGILVQAYVVDKRRINNSTAPDNG